jgi:hypothetical protein
MTTLRCTSKLLKAMKAKPAETLPEPSNRLGEWTANLIRVGRIQLVLGVNERTRLGVVTEAAPYKTVPTRLVEEISRSLLMIGVPEPEATAEAEATTPSAIAASNSRSVLATINQYSHSVDARLRAPLPPATLNELNGLLADQIMLKPEHIGFPADRVRELFGLPLMASAPRGQREISGSTSIHER